ncbi:NADH dehydrogenase [ubiquinone] 1 subunit C1, mitochondrial [Pelobates cultripes]|uniref:NADH dehydrogenase [ubiquinone] 1 subunit C1, mitochondrial n=1 Tax=Pelobates cultripes TaxID=61616 RepID=A0AAD1WEG3_PELCU|nr:NADH dehydrogenase [ubiquinone] 1 subunit C1, mitochondrial [Pelobates cultripes]
MLVLAATRSLRRPLRSFVRSMYTERGLGPSRPNWLRVSLTLGSTVAVWALLIKEHNDDVSEYKRRNGLE